jgi:hypothetical protein
MRGKNARQKGEKTVDLTIWIPGLFLLGVVGIGLLFAFIKACDNV